MFRYTINGRSATQNNIFGCVIRNEKRIISKISDRFRIVTSNLSFLDPYRCKKSNNTTKLCKVSTFVNFFIRNKNIHQRTILNWIKRIITYCVELKDLIFAFSNGSCKITQNIERGLHLHRTDNIIEIISKNMYIHVK